MERPARERDSICGMSFEGWYLLLGGLMLSIAFLDTYVRRLPITTTIVYLLVGVTLGPLGFGVISIHAVRHSAFLERMTELAVIVSLFTAGLKLRAPMRHDRWRIPLRLSFLSMALTVGLLTLVGIFLLNLPVGAAILLGAILAPTDPVLASDVQLEHAGDRDRLRFSLTGEAGLNDGTAFPFVMLGLGLLGLHEVGTLGWRWFAVDLLWAVFAGLGIGGMLGTLTGKFVVTLRKKKQETFGRDEFIALGLIGFSYGLALFAHAYGFLAVFAAGLALRQFERRTSGVKQPSAEPNELIEQLDEIDETGKTSVHVTGAVLGANEQLERLLEVAIVLMAGAMITRDSFTMDVLWFAPLLFLFIRPVAVLFGIAGCKATGIQKALLCWFGIRGIGSLYYLMYAIEKGLSNEIAEQLSALVVSVVVISVFVHGVSVSPVMRKYDRESENPDGVA